MFKNFGRNPSFEVIVAKLENIEQGIVCKEIWYLTGQKIIVEINHV
jgi:hypothetical protein